MKPRVLTSVAGLSLALFCGMAPQGPCERLLAVDSDLRPLALKSGKSPARDLLCSASSLREFREMLDKKLLGRSDPSSGGPDPLEKEFRAWKAAVCEGAPLPERAIDSVTALASPALLTEMNRCLQLTYEHRPGLRCRLDPQPDADAVRLSLAWEPVDIRKQASRGIFSRDPFSEKIADVVLWNGEIVAGADALRSGQRLSNQPVDVVVRRVDGELPLSVAVSTQGSECHFVVPPRPTVTITGRIWATRQTEETVKKTFRHERSSNDCGADGVVSTPMCLDPPNTMVKEWSKPVVRSVNERCGSAILDTVLDAEHPNCVIAQARLKGCGYVELPFGQRDCRGRGWFDYEIEVTGTVARVTNSEPFEFGPLVSNGPSVDVRYPADRPMPAAPGGRWLFEIEALIQQGPETRRAKLDTEHPASARDGLRATIGEDGTLRLSIESPQ